MRLNILVSEISERLRKHNGKGDSIEGLKSIYQPQGVEPPAPAASKQVVEVESAQHGIFSVSVPNHDEVSSKHAKAKLRTNPQHFCFGAPGFASRLTECRKRGKSCWRSTVPLVTRRYQVQGKAPEAVNDPAMSPQEKLNGLLAFHICSGYWIHEVTV